MNKIKDEELKLIIEQQKNLNEFLVKTGVLSFQKSRLIEEIDNIYKDIEDYKEILEKEYGQVNINLENGSYEAIEKENVEDKKD